MKETGIIKELYVSEGPVQQEWMFKIIWNQVVASKTSEQIDI